MIHGKSKSFEGMLYLKKPHFCPKCKDKLDVVTISRVVDSNSSEAKQYDFSISKTDGTYMAGNIEFSWQELKCPSCNRQFTIAEMQRIEYESLDHQQQEKENAKQNLYVKLFGFFLATVIIALVIFAILK